MTDHPEVDVLLAFQEERLGGDEAQRVRHHLVHCPDCAREVLSLGAFDEPSTAAAPSDAENLASWERYQQGLARQATGLQQPEPLQPEPLQPEPLQPEPLQPEPLQPELLQPGREESTEKPASNVRRGPWRLGNPWLLAASLLFAVTGLAARWPLLQNRPVGPVVSSGTEAPHLVALRLRPVGAAQRRNAAAVEHIALPASADTLIATLLIADQKPSSSYRVEVRNSAGDAVLVQRGVPRQKDGGFLLQLPRSQLPDDTYRLLLSAAEGAQEETLAVYEFALQTE